jgi:ribonuclease VapC
VIVDASALLAIIFSEAERNQFLDVLDNAGSISMSPINYVEVAIRVDRDPNPFRTLAFDEIMMTFTIDILPINAEQARIARQAHKSFGRGAGHPARLNLGDCFAFALAKVTREPLLFKGGDFAHPDILAEIESAL